MLFLALSPRHLRFFLASVSILAVVFVFSFACIAFAFSDDVVCPNAKLDGIYIGDMQSEALDIFVADHFKSLRESPIVIRVGKSVYTFSPEELGVYYDEVKTLEQLHSYRGSGVGYYMTAVSQFFGEKEFLSSIAFDGKKAKSLLAERVKELERPQNAQIVVEKGVWVVKPSRDGYAGDTDIVMSWISDQLRTTGKREMALQVYAVKPDFSTADAEGLLPKVRKITDNDHILVLEFGKMVRRYTVDFHDGQSWLTITRNNGGGWDASLNEVMIAEYIVNEVAPLIERDVQHVQISGFEKKNGRLYAIADGIAQDGVKIDLSETLRLLTEHIANAVTESKIVVDHIPAQILTPEDSPYTFPERVSVGMSNYATSSNDRIHNVKLGLSKFHNRVILPDEILSAVDHVMPVTNEAGYKDELAIFGGGGLKKVPGGGLCQVSTTLFRAFFNGGFQTVERFPHSLYVHYYTAYQDGLDATIYPGYGEWDGKDLRVKNDFSSPILVQTYTNDDTLDAVVQIYGTADGRTVAVAGPKYLANTWIGTDYIEDPNLAPGQEIVEASGSYGKLIYWERQITYADGKTIDEDLYSRYNAKKRVVRVGVGVHAAQ